MQTQTTQKFSRADYMFGKVSHADYYGQFVTPEIKAMVENAFGYQLRNRKHDEHLNTIPLRQWDQLAGVTNPGWEAQGGSPRGVIKLADDNSLASTVCVLKQAAKQLIREAGAK